MPDRLTIRTVIATSPYDGIQYAESPVQLPLDWPGYSCHVLGEDSDAEGMAREAAQRAPALPQDRTQDAQVNLAVMQYAGESCCELRRCETAEHRPQAVSVREEGDHLLITNAARRVALPLSGDYDRVVPGPILGWALRDGEALQRTRSMLLGVAAARVETRIESIGHHFVQWCVAYDFGAGGRWRQRGRWMREDDVIELADELETALAPLDGERPRWHWQPCGEGVESTVWRRGGGERGGPMEFVGYPENPLTDEAEPQRPVATIGHISYHNQWRQGWVTFRPVSGGTGTPEISVFGGWGGLWQRRGHLGLRVLLWRDAGRAILEAPLAAGLRCYGLVLHDGEFDGVFSDRFCHANASKVAHADLPVSKVTHWQFYHRDMPRDFTPPAGRLRLAPEAWLDALPDRVRGDAAVKRLLRTTLDDATLHNPDIRLAAAIALGDRRAAGKLATHYAAIAETWFEQAAAGGYEGIIIFHGRSAKAVLYSIDVLRRYDLIDDETLYRISNGLLMLAYIFSDPDFCIYGDFWPLDEPEEGIAEALASEMGDCPVPPNFASEYFSTVGLVAEYFPDHPMAAEWRAWACAVCDRFLEQYFAPDGTYAESINYHSHAILELTTWFVALRQNGGRDYFQHPAVMGSYRHFTQLALPPQRDGLPADRYLADPDLPARACYPANGNSGKNGQHQAIRPDLLLAARVYRDSDPALAGALMAFWRQAGRPLLESCAPLLNLLAWDPSIPEAPLPTTSVLRQTLGLVSRATLPGGEPVYLLVRAGRATHHMDFDQGSLQLTVGDRELISEHGYHTHDTDGKHIHAAATYLHSTVTYGPQPRFSSGYTGLEQAPDPEHVAITDAYDLVMHRIVNDNYRDLDRLAYNIPIPCATTIHYRYVLYAKPHHILIWDSFECVDQVPIWRLTTRYPVEWRDGALRSGVGPAQLRLSPLIGLRNSDQWDIGPLNTFFIRPLMSLSTHEFLNVLSIETDAAETPAFHWDAAARSLRFPALTVTLPPANRPGAMPAIDLAR